MSKQTTLKALELLSQRPLEPVFTTRDDGKAVFEVPDSFIDEKYEGLKDNIKERFGEDVDIKIPLRELPSKPNLDFTKPLGKRRQFSLFNNTHRRIAAQLIQIFMDAPDEDLFISVCAFCKDRVNPLLFQYCFAVATQHRKDLGNPPIQPIAEMFPQNFIEPSVFQDARAEGTVVKNPGDRRRIEIPLNYTASEREDEQRMGYFREDIGVNSHHWHWHLVYPGSGPKEVVDKDRRGELFYYMHHQIIARYNVERLCNNLKRIKVLNNVREPIPEGYFPKLLSSMNSRTYPGRVSNLMLKDVDREGNKLELADLDRWADRVAQAIDQGFVTDTTGKNIPLDPIHGIDILGNMLESSDLSINRTLYGNLHNEGHNAISFAHDPDFRFLEEFSVMGDVTTAMRDPVFYRWHGYLDSMFNRHKELLQPYEDAELKYEGIVIRAADVKVNSANAGNNVLITYWEKSDVDLGAGLDFGPNGNIFAQFTHLQHAPFNYNLQVLNSSDALKKGTCRIFLMPTKDERGSDFSMNEIRQLAVEMDKFPVTLNPGMNVINRASNKSSVTIPYERSFRNLGKDNLPTEDKALKEFQFCGCGWPEHMLLPKGKPEGLAYHLFFMISDIEGDAVQQVPGEEVCNDASSFCGLKDKKYPDRRAMGYPFDKRLTADNLPTLVSHFPNMKLTDIAIRFNNVVVDRKKN